MNEAPPMSADGFDKSGNLNTKSTRTVFDVLLDLFSFQAWHTKKIRMGENTVDICLLSVFRRVTRHACLQCFSKKENSSSICPLVLMQNSLNLVLNVTVCLNLSSLILLNYLTKLIRHLLSK